MKQGKCTRCEIRWYWDKETHSRVCCCPACGTHLRSTSHLLQWTAIKHEPFQSLNPNAGAAVTEHIRKKRIRELIREHVKAIQEAL